jgi:hypothetical protein
LNTLLSPGFINPCQKILQLKWEQNTESPF